ncbi:MAG: hypothetical protein ACJAY5_001589 [Actinomycetes bacterium]|jgi:hypothetical protein
MPETATTWIRKADREKGAAPKEFAVLRAKTGTTSNLLCR